MCETFSLSFFFFNDTATTEIYTLSLHDALPILLGRSHPFNTVRAAELQRWIAQGHYERILGGEYTRRGPRSEEHTSELQSQSNLVCRLLLEKKKKTVNIPILQHKDRPHSTLCNY